MSKKNCIITDIKKNIGVICMGAELMTEEEIARIGLYVKNHLGVWMEEGKILPFPNDIMFTERIVRVEEGIKHQGELIEKMLEYMEKRFEQVDKRFEEMQTAMEKRFEQVDKRFEQVDKRFVELREDMNKRFSHLQWTMGLGFTLLAALMGIFNFF